MKKTLLIINPASGIKQWRKAIPDLLTVFSGADHLPAVYLTRGRGDAAAFIAAHGGEYDLIAVCGGDGTLNEVVTGLLSAGHKTALGYLPAGSTNDFASGLGLSTNLSRACGDLVNAILRPLDIGCFGKGRYFTYTASFGLFASVSWSTTQNAKNILGHIAYILEGIRSLADVRPVHLKIIADGVAYERDFLFGAICNSTSLGGILKLDDSQVHMSDGLFEALLIPFPADLMVLNRILTALRTKNYENPNLIFVRAARFTVEAEEETHWSLDGEEALAEPVQEITNLHKAIRFALPAPLIVAE